MVSFLNRNNPALLLLYIIPVVIAIGSIWVNNGAVYSWAHDTPLSDFLNYLTGNKIKESLVLEILICHGLIVAQAILFNSLINYSRLFHSNSYFPGFFFLLVHYIDPQWVRMSQTIPANLFLLISLRLLFSIYKKGTCYREVYDIGFFSGLAFLVYSPYFLLLPFFLVSILVMRTFSWRESAIAVSGFITVIFLTACLIYLLNLLDYASIMYLLPDHEAVSRNLSHHIEDYFGVIAAGIITLFGLYLIQKNYYKSPVQQRNYFVVIGLLLLIMPITVMMNQAYSGWQGGGMIIPLAFAGTYGCMKLRYSWLSEVLFLLFLGGEVYTLYYPLFR